jgi:hypothetical protein
MEKVEEGYFRPSKYGSKKVADTGYTPIGGHTISILTGGATFAWLEDDGLPKGANALTWHGISGAQPAGEKIYAKGDFASVQLTAGSIRYEGLLRENFAVGTLWYVRPSGGTYGTEDGSSYANAWDGFSNIVWASIQPNDVLYICGTHTEALVVGASGTGPVGRSYSKPITIRGDYEGDPGIIDSQDTRNTGIDINSKNYITLISISSIDALIDCLQIRGTSTGIVTYNGTFTGSGNQGIQHEDSVSATHYNPTCTGNADDGISSHGTCRIKVINGTFSNNDQGINVIEGSHIKIEGAPVFSTNTTYDLYAVNATVDESAIIDVSGATLNGAVRADIGGKIILRNCTVGGNISVATTAVSTGFLAAYNSTLSGGTMDVDDNANCYFENCTISTTNTIETSTKTMVFVGCNVTTAMPIVSTTTATRTVFAEIDFITGNTSTFTNCLIKTFTTVSKNIYGTVEFDGCVILDGTPVPGDLTVKNCLFDNAAYTDHLLDIVSGGSIDISNTTFKGMAAAKFGIALRTGCTVVSVRGCNFIDTVNSGAGVFSQVNVDINNCIFYNLATGVNRNAGTVNTYNCVFYSNTNDTVGTVTQTASQAGDPVFADVSNNDYSLGAASSANSTGKNLGRTLNDGIVSANWGNKTTEVPAVITGKQPLAAWDIGAYIS